MFLLCMNLTRNNFNNENSYYRGVVNTLLKNDRGYEFLQNLCNGEPVLDELDILNDLNNLDCEKRDELKSILKVKSLKFINIASLKNKNVFADKILTRLFYFKYYSNDIKEKVDRLEYSSFMNYNLPFIIETLEKSKAYNILSDDALQLIEEFKNRILN